MSCRHSNKQQGAALVIALLVFALAAALMVGVQRDFNLQLQRSTNTFFAESRVGRFYWVPRRSLNWR